MAVGCQARKMELEEYLIALIEVKQFADVLSLQLMEADLHSNQRKLYTDHLHW